MAGDKDSCMLKCHVFRCDVPAKAIASALHELCAQVRARGWAGKCGYGAGAEAYKVAGVGWYWPLTLIPFFLCGLFWLRCILDLVRASRGQC